MLYADAAMRAAPPCCLRCCFDVMPFRFRYFFDATLMPASPYIFADAAFHYSAVRYYFTLSYVTHSWFDVIAFHARHAMLFSRITAPLMPPLIFILRWRASGGAMRRVFRVP